MHFRRSSFCLSIFVAWDTCDGWKWARVSSCVSCVSRLSCLVSLATWHTSRCRGGGADSKQLAHRQRENMNNIFIIHVIPIWWPQQLCIYCHPDYAFTQKHVKMKNVNCTLYRKDAQCLMMGVKKLRKTQTGRNAQRNTISCLATQPREIETKNLRFDEFRLKLHLSGD